MSGNENVPAVPVNWARALVCRAASRTVRAGDGWSAAPDHDRPGAATARCSHLARDRGETIAIDEARRDVPLAAPSRPKLELLRGADGRLVEAVPRRLLHQRSSDLAFGIHLVSSRMTAPSSPRARASSGYGASTNFTSSGGVVSAAGALAGTPAAQNRRRRESAAGRRARRDMLAQRKRPDAPSCRTPWR